MLRPLHPLRTPLRPPLPALIDDASPPGDDGGAAPPDLPSHPLIVHLDQLLPPDDATRPPPPAAREAALLASIRAAGLVSALLATPADPAPDGRPRYRVVDGAERLAALRTLVAEAPAPADRHRHERVIILVRALTDAERLASRFASQRLRDFAPLEQARLLAGLKAHLDGASNTLVGARVGLPHHRVDYLLELVRYPELAAALERRAIGVTAAHHLARLANPRDRADALARLAAGGTITARDALALSRAAAGQRASRAPAVSAEDGAATGADPLRNIGTGPARGGADDPGGYLASLPLAAFVTGLDRRLAEQPGALAADERGAEPNATSAGTTSGTSRTSRAIGAEDAHAPARERARGVARPPPRCRRRRRRRARNAGLRRPSS